MEEHCFRMRRFLEPKARLPACRRLFHNPTGEEWGVTRQRPEINPGGDFLRSAWYQGRQVCVHGRKPPSFNWSHNALRVKVRPWRFWCSGRIIGGSEANVGLKTGNLRGVFERQGEPFAEGLQGSLDLIEAGGVGEV